MNDVQVTLVGTITSEIRFTSTGDNPIAKFRIRAQPRRYNKATNAWQDGEASYYTAIAWRHLAEHVASSLGVGDPVLAHGRLRVARWRVGEDPQLTAEVELVSIGHDLRWGTTVYRKAQPPPLMRRSGPRDSAPGGELVGVAAASGAGASAEVRSAEIAAASKRGGGALTVVSGELAADPVIGETEPFELTEAA